MVNRASNASRGIDMSPSTSATPPPGARPQVDVVAITASDDFLIELGDMLAGQTTVHPADSAADAVEQIRANRRGQMVLVVDASGCADLRADVELALTQAPHVVTLVFVPAEQEEEVREVLSDLQITAVLPIPFERRKTKLALDSALSDAATRRAPAPPPPPPRRPTNAGALDIELEPVQPIGSLEAMPRRNNAGLVVAAAVAALAVAGGGAWWWLSRPAAHTARLPGLGALPGGTAAADDEALFSTQLVDNSVIAGKLDDLLEKARLAMRQRHFADPKGDNALLYYRSALAVDPNNAEARDGLQRVASVLLARFDETLAAGRLEEANRTLASLGQALPGDPRLQGMQNKLVEKQMNRLLADGNLETANRLLQQQAVIPPEQLTRYRAEIARRQEELKVARLVAQVEGAIRDGRLLEPADDSARALVQQLQAAAPNSPQTQRAVRDLNAAFLRRARDTKGSPEMDRWLQEARAGGTAAGEIEAVRREAAAARQKAESDRLLGLFHDRLRDGKLTEAQDSAAFYVTQLQGNDPNGTALATARGELAARLLERARNAINAGRNGSADADMTQAQRFGASSKDISALQQLEASRQAAVASASASVAASKSSAPASTASEPANATPKLLRYSPPEFPQKAAAQGIGGSVTVQFVIDGKGDPQNVRVVEATPPGIFDRAAIAAVKRWHYQPSTSPDGKPVDVPVQMAIRFPKPE